jgi:hypothetical protein
MSMIAEQAGGLACIGPTAEERVRRAVGGSPFGWLRRRRPRRPRRPPGSPGAGFGFGLAPSLWPPLSLPTTPPPPPCPPPQVLDVVPQRVHQKSPLFVGSASEVRRLQAFLKARKGK